MPDGLSPTLDAYGLKLDVFVRQDGGVVFHVSGETHRHRQVLRQVGGQWDAIKQIWVFEGEDPSRTIADGIEMARAQGGLKESAEPVALGDRPHYWGHRQRLRDRFLDGLEEALPDYELLELLLFFSIPRVDTKPLAKALLARFGSLAGVVHASSEQLSQFEPMNHFTITLFKALRVFAMRVAREEISDQPVLDNWDKLVSYLRASMAHRRIEQFRVLFLDRRNVLITDEVQHEGSIDHTPVYPREVVKRALDLDASAIVMVHNHPSNHPTPSKPDIEMTRQVRDALDRVGVVLHDHIIVSKKGHTSFRQMQLLGR